MGGGRDPNKPPAAPKAGVVAASLPFLVQSAENPQQKSPPGQGSRGTNIPAWARAEVAPRPCLCATPRSCNGAGDRAPIEMTFAREGQWPVARPAVLVAVSLDRRQRPLSLSLVPPRATPPSRSRPSRTDMLRHLLPNEQPRTDCAIPWPPGVLCAY